LGLSLPLDLLLLLLFVEFALRTLSSVYLNSFSTSVLSESLSELCSKISLTLYGVCIFLIFLDFILLLFTPFYISNADFFILIYKKNKLI